VKNQIHKPKLNPMPFPVRKRSKTMRRWRWWLENGWRRL